MPQHPFKTIFHLQQHTPIIHFQDELQGAALRATEVKPKLDIFILQKLGNGNKEEGLKIAKKNHWLIGDPEQKALDYQLSFLAAAEQEYYLPMPLPRSSWNYPHRDINLANYVSNVLKKNVKILAPCSYFANSDKVDFERESNEVKKDKVLVAKMKLAIFSDKPTRGKIFVLRDDLKNVLEEHLEEFFLIHNFGSRQNKGFGSYTLENLNSKELPFNNDLLKQHYLKKSERSYPNFQVFKFLDKEYKFLKSGLSFPRYEKSKLFLHFALKKIRWEKRYIKKGINGNKIRGKRLKARTGKPPIYFDQNSTEQNIHKKCGNSWKDDDKQINEYAFVRALLGLAENYEFLVDGSQKDNYFVSIVHQPQQGEEKIERFKSPVFFKIIDDVVYCKCNQSYKDIEGKTFELSYKLKSDKRDSDVRSLDTLTVPQNFDLRSFLNRNLNKGWQKT